TQWYDGASTEADAARISIVPPQAKAAVDARLIGTNPHIKPPSVVVTLIEVPAQQPNPLKCKKHFHRKKVKGKVRCVKIHKKHHPHRHHPKRGPRAVAIGH